MTKTIFNFTQYLPANIVGGILAVLISGIVILFTKIIIPKLKFVRSDIQRKKNSDKALLRKQNQVLIHTLHSMMTEILNRCYRKGFRNDYDVREFMLIYADYNHLGGNTDGKVMYEDFIKIPYRTILEVPERLGVRYPTQDANDIMHRYYTSVMMGVIDESDVKPRKVLSVEADNNIRGL